MESDARLFRCPQPGPAGKIRKELHHAESQKAPFNAPHRQPPCSRLSFFYRAVWMPQLPRKEVAPSSLP